MFWEHVGKWKGLIIYRLYGSVYDLQIPWDIEFFSLRTSRTLPICLSKLWNCKNKTKQNRVCSMWQTSNQRALCKTSKKTLIFWNALWEPHTGFQPPSVSSSQEFWEEIERQDSGLFQEESFLLISFTYLALQWLSFSLKKIFLDQRKDSRNICGCWRLDLNVSYFPPWLCYSLDFLMIFLEWNHIQTRVWNPKAKNAWYFFPHKCVRTMSK